MSIALADMVTDLQEDVPALNGVPSSSKYARIVQEAVDDLNRRAPERKITTLTIVANTASYALPTDFMKLISLALPLNANGLLVTDVLIPLSRTRSRENYYVRGRIITFTPTPTGSMERDVWYAAGHVLDESDEYPDMTSEDARLALMLACANALKAIADSLAAAGSGKIKRYRIGDEEVERSDQKKELSDEAESWRAQYLDAVKARVGVTGARSRVDVNEA